MPLREIIGERRVSQYSRTRGQRVYENPETGSVDFDSKYQGVQFMETWEPIIIPKSVGDALHVVNAAEEGRLDLISLDYYDTTNYDWVIAMVNGLPDMVQSVKAGTGLRIPIEESIVARLR